jgi:hypothetical protein
MTTEAQYVPSLAGGNMLVLEDDNTLGSTASNNFGKPYSGLDDRMWIQQGPDGSTWQIIHDTSGSGGITEQYLYTPQGQVTVIILSGGSYVAPNGNSQPTYSPSGFRYLFKGDRAEIYANESATSGTILSMFDGLYSTQSGEYDGYAGTPLGEDVQIYGTPNNISSDIYNPYVSEDVDDSGDGTSGQWIDPSTTLGWWGNFAEALPDAFADTVSSNAQAVGGAIQQFGYTLADLGNDAVYDTTFANSYIDNFGDLTQTNGVAFYNGHLSAIEQGIDSGAVNPLSWGYVGQSVYGAANAMSFGTLDEVTASVEYGAGGLSADQFGNRLAVGAFTNFVSAATLPAGANIDVGAAANQAAVYAGGFWEGLNAGGQSIYTPSLLGGIQGTAEAIYSAHLYALEDLSSGFQDIVSERFPFGEHGLAASKGFPGIARTAEGGPDFAGSNYLYPGQGSIQDIILTGSRTADIEAANAAAGLQETPLGYVWHHVDNFDPVSGMGTLQLVEQAAHEATFPHYGGVAQYEAYHNLEYGR